MTARAWLRIAIVMVWGSVAAFGQIPVELLRGSVLGISSSVSGPQKILPPLNTRVNIVVTDAVAQAVVTQIFLPPEGGASEAVFYFPLPEQGSVNGMRYAVGSAAYVAKIMEKEKAEARYDSLVKNGGQGAMTLQHKPNVFEHRLATLKPGIPVTVEVRVSWPLKYVDGELEVAFPTHLATATVGGFNPPENRAGPSLQVNVLLQSGVDFSGIYSPSHLVRAGTVEALKADMVAGGLMEADQTFASPFVRGVLFRPVDTYPNRDYVLRLRRAQTAPEFSLATYRDAKGQGYFYLNLYPDVNLFTGSRPDLELILMVDATESQAGWPMDRQKEIALNLLSRLTERDKVTLFAFGGGRVSAPPDWVDRGPKTAGRAVIAQAETFLRTLVPAGEASFLEPLTQVLGLAPTPGKKRLYVFLTDGQVADAGPILTALSEHATRPTVFVFGTGNNLSRGFMEDCAAIGNGFAVEVMEWDATGPQVEASWERLAAAQLENIQVDFGGMEVTETHHPVSRVLYRGLPYQMTGKYAAGGSFTVTLSADRAGKPVSYARTLQVASGETSAWAVPKLWARERIGRLMQDQAGTLANRSTIVALSLEHEVLSAYTAFLAAAAEKESSIPSAIRPVRGGAVPAWSFEVRAGYLNLFWKTPAAVATIRIHDLHGRLVHEFRPAGGVLAAWSWDGRDSRGRYLERGRYLVSVRGVDGMRSRSFDWNPARP